MTDQTVNPSERHLLQRHYGGWRPSLPHPRRRVADTSGITILDEVDPRKDLPPIFDQSQLGSCTANATAAHFQYDGMLDGADPGLLARLWIYWQERAKEGSLGQGDTGAFGSDAFWVASHIGVPPETAWPYDISTFDPKQPPVAATDDEGHYKLVKPYATPTLSVQAFQAVFSNKQLISFGFSVFESFEVGDVVKTGIVPLPGPGESQLGGHETVAVGYLKSEPNYCLCRNSWGEGWGLGGYFLMPWAYLLDPNLCGDWTTIQRPA